jgi:formate hydrogenlyase transcriptional activator
VSNLDIDQLLAAISSCLHQVKQFDFSTVALYDSQTNSLKTKALQMNSGAAAADEIFPATAASPAAWVFTTQKPLLLSTATRDWPFGAQSLPGGAQALSGCWLPLAGRAGVLGTLNILSRRADAFSTEDMALFGQVANQIGIALENAMAFANVTDERNKLAEEKNYLEDEIRTGLNLEEIVGRSRALDRVLKQLESVAPTDSTVLILGETGTGKELLARAVHNHSSRRERTFVRVNCAALPAGLLESELFGHEKGAFTGAIYRRTGRVELAHQGTLFLDEVGDIPLELQSKLLRFLQEKEFERLGSTRTIVSDARIVAATNRDLGKMVATGEFRRDLYYRLNVFPIVVPPLRERADDIPLLFQYFLAKYSKKMKRHITSVPHEIVDALVRYSWPGNVRELEHVVERAVIVSPGTELVMPPFESELATDTTSAQPSLLADVEREHILDVLRRASGRIAGPGGAAEQLGMNRTTLNSRLRKLGISRKDI